MGETADFESPVLRIEHDQTGTVATLWLDGPRPAMPWARTCGVTSPGPWSCSRTTPRCVVVVAAQGPHFSVGLDLKAMGAMLTSGGDDGVERDGSSPAPPWPPGARRSHQCPPPAGFHHRRPRCPKPVIAAVHGYCIGGGVDLIAACDIRLASSDAIFSVREAKMAIVADLGSLQRLPAHHQRRTSGRVGLHGQGHKRSAGQGDRTRQRRGRRCSGGAEGGAGTGGRIAANSPIAVQGTKAVLVANEGRTVAEGLDYVATWNAGMLASDDLTEAVTAFMEKRPAG